MENFDPTARKFLFKCSDCQIIVEVDDFKEQHEIDKVVNDEIELECTCGGICNVILD